MKKFSQKSSKSAVMVSQMLAAAIAHHQAGRLSEAEQEYGRILAIDPKHPHALHFLGVIAHQLGNQERAVALISDAVKHDPNNSFAHNNLGAALSALGKIDEAVVCYQKTLALQPESVEAYYNLAKASQTRGKLDEAIAFYQKLLALQPAHIDAHNSLGQIYNAQGKADEAMASFAKVLAITPASPEVHNNIGSVYNSLGRLDEALVSYRKALSIKSDFVEAWYNLGHSLNEQGKLNEAVDAYQRALAIRPAYAEANHNLGNIFQTLGRFDDAVACFKAGLQAKPDSAEIHNNLGSAFDSLQRLEEAEAEFRKALTIKPDFAEANNNLGRLLMGNGRLAEAVVYYREALEADPGQIEARGNLLMSILYDTKYSPAEVLDWHRQFSAHFDAPFLTRPGNDADPERRLRIGYVSADFNQHVVSRFAEPMIQGHDRNSVEVFCYYNNTRRDDVTERISSAADHWRACKVMSDDALEACIRNDGIDILVDLSGHTAGNRLAIFARRPAPVQVTYLGYGATTGLDAMDYRLTHVDADPPINDAYNSEVLYRLPNSLWCYRPRPDMPEVAPLPMLRNGFVTFGMMNGFHKVSSAMIAVWADILRQVPTARLVMVPVPGPAQASVHEQFAALGIAPDRIILHGRLTPEKFWDLYSEIDIAFDPFPYNGGTTTCETLWLGVPVVTLTGQGFVSRLGYTLLKGIGLPELAASTEAEYVEIATFLARDIELLGVLRAGMRQRIAASPLRDETGFVRSLEAAYRDMWRTWCRTRHDSHENSHESPQEKNTEKAIQ